MEVSWAELEAFNEGLKLATRLKVVRLIMEFDSAVFLNTVNKKTKDTLSRLVKRLICQRS